MIVAEDDRDLRGLIAYALRLAGYDVVECAHGPELVSQLQAALEGDSNDVRGVITDIRMPGVTGLSVLEGMTGMGIEIPVFVITAFGSPETHALARRFGAVRTFDKPFDLDDFVGEVVRTVGL